MFIVRQIAALLFGLVAWYAIVIASDYVLVNILELSTGARFAFLGAAEFVLGGGVIVLALRFARLRPADVGWTIHRIGPDVIAGLTIAVLFAILQFLVIIPATGGAERTDIIANAAQMGEAPTGLVGILILALLGSTSEELLFRGLLLGGVASVFGGGKAACILATVVVVVLFALSHGYQGWAGIIDTGFYGGLLLSLLYWWRKGRLAAPIAAHVGWNMIASVVIFTLY